MLNSKNIWRTHKEILQFWIPNPITKNTKYWQMPVDNSTSMWLIIAKKQNNSKNLNSARNSNYDSKPSESIHCSVANSGFAKPKPRRYRSSLLCWQGVRSWKWIWTRFWEQVGRISWRRLIGNRVMWGNLRNRWNAFG
jgi:hypothetical protein